MKPRPLTKPCRRLPKLSPSDSVFMPYILKDLLTVRIHRENKALNQVERAKAALHQAEALKVRKEEELAAFRQWRVKEEQRLTTALVNQTAKVRDLMQFTDAINGLRAEQAAKTRAVHDAAQQIVQAQADLATAQKEYAMAYRKKAKIESHKEIWMEAYHLKLAQEAEKELEEFSQASPQKGSPNP